MSDLQALLHKLHMLAGPLDASVGGASYTHDDHNSQTTPDEDTPEIAVARNLEVSKLKRQLLAMTTMCPLIQKEADNAMTRFLFSGTLQKKGHGFKDFLLPTCVFYDRSICRELEKVNVSEKDARDICEKLCTQSIQSVKGLQDLKMKDSESHSDVRLREKSNTQWQVSWNSNNLLISDYHLQALRKLYHATDDPSQEHFNQRLFCLLMRYETVGGSMYQCSITPKTFAALQTQFKVTKECMASPFNHNADIYWSAFQDTDCYFKSQGSFFASLESPLVTEGGSFMANPPFVEEILHLLTQHIQKILEFQVPVSFICLYPTWPDDNSYNSMKISPYCKKCVVLEPHHHAYIDGKQQVNTVTTKKHHVAQFKTTLFIVQNEMGSKQWPVNDQKMQILLESFAVM